jgi:glycosyltransferase involved in cell wall biosynthesis
MKPKQHQPLISCVMLTANRQHLVQSAVDSFNSQTWVNKELIVLDTGEERSGVKRVPGVVHIFRGLPASIGELRNRANVKARGRFICHYDDDWSAPERVEQQYELLTCMDADVVGYRTLYFRREMPGGAFEYWLYRGEMIDPLPPETTFFYRRVTWENRPFVNAMMAEGIPFLHRRKVVVADGHRPPRMIARHHAGSVSRECDLFGHRIGNMERCSDEVSDACERLLKP